MELTEALKRHIAETGYDRTFGARPLRRTIQRDLETPLSKRLLRGDIKSGQTVVVGYTPEEGISFLVGDTVPVEAVEAEPVGVEV